MSLISMLDEADARLKTSPFRDWVVWGCLLAVFMFIYGAMLVRGGYHWDETLDFAGNALETYVANGRWGLVLWRCLFGMGCAVWCSGLLAGMLLCASLVLQGRLLCLNHVGLQLLYGIIYLLQIQFAYQMDYFFLCDATAFGLLGVTAAVYLLEQGGKWRSVAATLLVTWAVAIYQCLVLNFVVLVGLLILRDVYAGQAMHLLRRGVYTVVVCVAAVSLWVLVKIPVQLLLPVDADSLAFCQEYAQRLNCRIQLFSSEWYLYIGRMFSTMVQHACWPANYDGEPFYLGATAALLVLLVAAVRIKGMQRKVLAFVLPLSLWLAPFCMYMVIGATWPCYPHTKLAQPVVLAGLCLLAVPHLRWSPLWRGVGAGVLALCLVQASSLVSRHAAGMQAAFEERLLRLHHAETEAVRVAIENGILLEKGCILYYPAYHNWEKNGYVDFCGDYPALLYMKGATDHELYCAKHREHLRHMPAWPAKGAIKVVDDTVIIKGAKL